MGKIIKPIPDPPGTIFKGLLEIDAEMTFVEAHIQDDNLVILMQGFRLGCKKEMLIQFSLLQIIDTILQGLRAQQAQNEAEKPALIETV